MRYIISNLGLSILVCTSIHGHGMANRATVEVWNFFGAKCKYPAETREIQVQNTEGTTIWVGTTGGLISLDKASGKSVRYDLNDLPAYDVTAIELNGNNGLWAIAANTLWKFDGTNWSSEKKYATSMLKLADGTLVLCTTDSLQWYRNGVWGGRAFLKTQNYGRVINSRLAATPEGSVLVYTIWAGGDTMFGAMLDKIDPKSGLLLQHIGAKGSTPIPTNSIPSLQDMVSDSSGTVWTTDGRNIYRVADTGLVTTPFGLPSTASVTSLLAGSAPNALWIGTAQGLFQWNGSQATRVPSQEVGVQDNVRHISHASDGKIWVSTTENFKAYFQGAWMKMEIPSIPLPSNAIQAVARGGAGMWVGTNSGLAYYSGGFWATAQIQGIPSGTTFSVTSLAMEVSKIQGAAVWGVAAGLGIFRFNPDTYNFGPKITGKWTWYSDQFPVLPREIYDVVQGEPGVMWAMGLNGLFRFAVENWEAIPEPRVGMPRGPKSLAHDGKGTLWVGSSNSLMRFDGSTWRVERDSGMMDLVFDSEGRLWGQGNTGFYWYESGEWHKKPFSQYSSKADGEIIRTVHGLAADDYGNIMFQQTLCGPGSMFCSTFPFYSRPTQFGYVNRDTVVVIGLSFPDVPPTCIAVDGGGFPWIGTARGLVHGYQNYDVSLVAKDPSRIARKKSCGLFGGLQIFSGFSNFYDLRGRMLDR